MLAQVDLRLARDLAAQAQLGVLGDKADAGLQRAQRGLDAGLVVAQARPDAHAGDDDATVATGSVHQKPSVLRNRPTRRPSATPISLPSTNVRAQAITRARLPIEQ